MSGQRLLFSQNLTLLLFGTGLNMTWGGKVLYMGSGKESGLFSRQRGEYKREGPRQDRTRGGAVSISDWRGLKERDSL